MDFGSGRFKGVYMEENDMAYPYFEAWKQPLVSLGFDTFSPMSVGSTDHVSFTRLGLPAFQFIQDPLDYFRAYHTTMDTYERLSLDDLKVNAAIVAWLAYSAAMDDGRIPVKPGYPKHQKNKSNHFFHRERRNRIVHGCAFIFLSYLELFPVVGGAHAKIVLNVAAEIAGR